MPDLTTRERLARVEANLEQLVFETRQLHGELRGAVDGTREAAERQEGRIRALEQNAEQTRTHLRWMKAAWVAVQGAVLTWVGLK